MARVLLADCGIVDGSKEYGLSRLQIRRQLGEWADVLWRRPHSVSYPFALGISREMGRLSSGRRWLGGQDLFDGDRHAAHGILSVSLRTGLSDVVKYDASGVPGQCREVEALLEGWRGRADDGGADRRLKAPVSPNARHGA